MNTPITTNQQTVDMKVLFAQYGEAMMQLKVATSRVQQIELQLQQILNAQQIPLPQA